MDNSRLQIQQIEDDETPNVVQTDLQKEKQENEQGREVKQESIVPDINYREVIKTLLPTLRNNKDLLNFAYYLHKQELVKAHPDVDADWIAIRQGVNFCDCTKYRSPTKTMNVSRLEQMYIVDLFPADFFTVLWAEKKHLPHDLTERCNYCHLSDCKSRSFCPYYINYFIERAATEVYKVSPENLYEKILGDERINFRGRCLYKVPNIVPHRERQGIDSKSAYGAYLLLASRMVSIHSFEGPIVAYSYLPICRADLKHSIVEDIIDFWKNGCGVIGTLNAENAVELLHAKTEGCKKCTYEQCPHKLAAYFSYLGEKYHLDPIDLAYDIAEHSTYAGVYLRDDYQFNKWLAVVKQAPMTEASKVEFIKMIHFITGRKMNRDIPFLPFNIVVTSPDKEQANEIISNFCNAVWHMDYYRRGLDNTKSENLYISSLSFMDLCQKYQDAKPATTFILHDVSLLCENREFKEGHHKLLKILKDRRNDVMSIVVGEKTEIFSFFDAYPSFKRDVFTKTLEMCDMSNESVLDALEDKLTQTFTIPDDVHIHLDQYIRVTYLASSLRSMSYVNDLYEKILFNHYNHDVHAGNKLSKSDVPYVKPPRTEQEIFEEINSLTGLANVKKELSDINNLVKFNIKIGAISKNAVNLHMVFTGNPGTGKTTVAKLTAEILYSIGFIRENKLVVCSAKDLIGEYLGQTTPKTAKMCERAYNGILFIDEAYQLSPTGTNDSYKEECIAELIQQMENNRDKLVVIFAGYSEEMEHFLNHANTGLSSRIGKVIHFPDYSTEELVEIFENIVHRAGLTLGNGARNKAEDIFRNAKQDAKRFGNARYARNLYERSLMQHAAITANMDKDDPALKVLRRDEITVPNV